MSIDTILQNIGLTKSEVATYKYLLANGVSTPAQIARGTTIARTNSYHVLRRLMEKGLIDRQKHKRRVTYLAKDPNATKHLLQGHLEVLEEALPDLKALYRKQRNKPSIQFFDGWEEVKDLYRKTLEAEELLGVGNTERMKEISPRFFKEFQKELKVHAVISKNVYPLAAKGKSAKEIHDALGALEEVKFLPEKYKESPSDIFIWNDNIALISLDEPIFGTLITNNALADTLRMFFDFMWSGSRG